MTEQLGRLAVTAHRGRVSPLFDASQELKLFDLSESGAAPSGTLALSGLLPPQRLTALRGSGVGTLICGAITGYTYNLLSAGGIRVIPWVCGPVEGVVDAYRRHTLAEPAWRMPGCRRGRFGRCGRGRGGPGPRRRSGGGLGPDGLTSMETG